MTAAIVTIFLISLCALCLSYAHAVITSKINVLRGIFNIQVRFDQDRRNRLIIATGQRQRGSRAARQ